MYLKYFFSLIFSCSLIVIPVVSNGQYANQHAFHPDGIKNIFLDRKFAESDFKLVDGSGKVILKGRTSKASLWKYSGTKVCIADVTQLKLPGTYELRLKGLTYKFNVSLNSYREVGRKIMKSFYLARASEPVLEKNAGIYSRAAGHPDDRVLIHSSAATPSRPEGFVISSPGGWYDAGDYNKYVVNSAITVFTMLHTYELFKNDLDTFDLNIPESGNKIPDILDEAFFNIKWMLTMQDPDDGGVYHKLTSLNFCGFIMPEKDKLPRYVVLKSTAATLGFAATMAKASRIFRELGRNYEEIARVFLNSAVKAYEWSVINPGIIYANPADVKTGAYDDTDLRDEWYWASMELYLSTGNPGYLNKINNSEQIFTVPEWRRTNIMGIYSLMTTGDKNGKLDIEKYKKPLVRIAENKYSKFIKSAFRIPIEVFPWGSNSEVANDGILSLYAYLYTGDRKFLDVADACANYLLGANPAGKCFITGFGQNYPKFPHDRRSSADGIADPLPGLVIGGPTKAVRSDCGEEKYKSVKEALSYVDLECSYSTNETAINWNSAGAALFLGLDFVHKKMREKK